MNNEPRSATSPSLRVIDALDHPHGGRILRVRVANGDPPRVRDLKGSRFRAVSADGVERDVRVLDFASFGGKPSDERLRRQGRVDLVVEEEGDGPPVAVNWRLHPV